MARDVDALAEHLMQTEQRLQTLLDHIPDCIARFDAECRYVFVSPALTRLFDLPAGQLLGKRIAEAGTTGDPAQDARLEAMIRRAFEEGQTNSSEAQWTTADGERFFEVLHIPENDEDGRVVSVLCIAHDITQRKRAGDELRASEARFRIFADHAMDAFFLHGEDGTVLDVNRQACLSLGYSRDEMIGMSPGAFDTDLSPEFRETMRARVYDGGIVTLASHHRRKDGGVFPVEVRLRPFQVGEQRMHISMARDISERKRVEDDLHRLNRELRAISLCHQTLLRASDEQGLLDEICRIIVEEAGYRLAWVGYAEGDEARTVHPVAWSGDDGEYLLQSRISWSEDSAYGQGPAASSIRSGDIVHIRDIATDAGMAPWHASALARGYRTCISLPLKDVAGRVFGALLIYSSEPGAITPEEIRLMEELSHDLAFGIDVLRTREERGLAEEKYRTIFENSPLGIFRSTLEGRFVEMNLAMAHMLGYETPEEAAREIGDIGRQMYAEGYDRGRVVRAQMGAGDDATQYVSRYRRRDGSEFDATLYLKTVRNTAGKPIMFDGIVEDITDRVQAESEAERLQAQLVQAQKMESVGRLAGGIAHDFNNMLAAIMGYAELAMQGVDSGQRLFVHLQEIHRAASRSADLTRQLLGFARKQPTLPAVLDLNQMVEGMLKMLRRLIGEDIRLEWLPGGEMRPVRIDPGQIDQVLANLCVNARDAIEDVGSITIETRSLHLDRDYCVDHPWAEVGDYVLLAVRDDGVGMDEETLGKVFEPFFTTKAVGQGTGLGLAMVYGIVKQNDGFIDIRSRLGQGTCVEIYLPQHAGGAGLARVEDAAVETVSRGHETILLVEDEPVVLDMTTLMLEDCGYRVLGASDPADALRLAHAHAGGIGLLLTDVVMPGMNGHALSTALGSLYPGIRTLFMSGYPGNAIAQHGVLAQGVHFIQKPFTIEDLAAKVREVLDAA